GSRGRLETAEAHERVWNGLAVGVFDRASHFRLAGTEEGKTSGKDERQQQQCEQADNRSAQLHARIPPPSSFVYQKLTNGLSTRFPDNCAQRDSRRPASRRFAHMSRHVTSPIRQCRARENL